MYPFSMYGGASSSSSGPLSMRFHDLFGLDVIVSGSSSSFLFNVLLFVLGRSSCLWGRLYGVLSFVSVFLFASHVMHGQRGECFSSAVECFSTTTVFSLKIKFLLFKSIVLSLMLNE